MLIEDCFEGCIIGGIIGDAWGSSYESESMIDYSKTYVWGELLNVNAGRKWEITDDTQLTLATCEALCEDVYTPDKLSKYFLHYYKEKRLSGMGTSTLKALKDLDAGMHWRLSGRSGEYAAGNGVAMRVAPFAFFPIISREDIYEASIITHRNDEAYVGALAVFLTIKFIIEKKWDELKISDLFEFIITQLPDTNVRDRLIEISKLPDSTSIQCVSKLGNNGYVVNSVPFAIFSATQVLKIGLTRMFEQIIKTGGDTDTNSSIAGQIAGAIISINNISNDLVQKIELLPEYDWIKGIIDKTKFKLGGNKI